MDIFLRRVVSECSMIEQQNIAGVNRGECE